MLRLRFQLTITIGMAYAFIAPASGSHMVQFILSNSAAKDVDYDANSTYWLENFHSRCNTSVIIPGWRSSAFDDEFGDIAEGYLSIPNACFNTIRVNWPDAKNADYTKATAAMGKVSEEVAIFLRRLQRLEMVRSIEVVGFSLGAHLAGLVGRMLRDYFGQKDLITEIIGLDPAGPGFTDLYLPYQHDRLTDRDARIVVVLITNAGCSGSSMHLGSINFIANNGRDQTGCATHDCICSHHRALDYFTESLTSVGFVGMKTSDLSQHAVFGRGRSAETPPGDYTFRTHMSSPYAL